MLKLRAIIKLLIKSLLLSGFGFIAAICGFVLYASPNLPSVEQLRDVKLQTPLKIFAADGSLMDETGAQKRSPITYEQIPQAYIDAILSAEDTHFFNHNGVDYKGLLRAIKGLATTGRFQGGGSTITMQLARNFFLTNERKITRKFKEILLAIRIEQLFTKKEILSLYSSKIFLGKRAYGIQAAANVYYGRNIDQLTLAEIAMIAGLPKAPSNFNPINNPDRAVIRRNWIIGRMLKLGHIDQSTHDQQIAAPITAATRNSIIELHAPYVAEMVRDELLNRFGTKAYTDGYRVITTLDSTMQRAANESIRQGIEIYDIRHGYRGAEQRLSAEKYASDEAVEATLKSVGSIAGKVPAIVLDVANQSANVYIKGIGSKTLEWEDGLSSARKFKTHSWTTEPFASADKLLKVGDLIRVEQKGERWKLTQVPKIQGALISLNPKNGSVLALVGGYNFYHNKFNRAINAKRQPGSSLKPFVYMSALEKGYTLATTINDAPIVVDDQLLEDTWRPTNDSKRFYGPTRLRQALYYSRNLVSIRILRALGVRETRKYLTNLGFQPSELANNLTLVLGSQALQPIKVAAAYASLANGGYRVTPNFIDRIIDSEGNVVFQSNNPRVCSDCQSNLLLRNQSNYDSTSKNSDLAARRVIEPRVHFLINSILQDVIKIGTGKSALTLGRSDLAGKTGTTNGPKDAWFSGYNQDVVTTAWVGFDDNSLLGNAEFGGTAALPIWIQYMKTALKDKPEVLFEQPAGIVTALIDRKTGQRAQPNDRNSQLEYFLKENTPEPLTENVGAKKNETETATQDQIF